jgi:hypothetical protein
MDVETPLKDVHKRGKSHAPFRKEVLVPKFSKSLLRTGGAMKRA